VVNCKGVKEGQLEINLAKDFAGSREHSSCSSISFCLAHKERQGYDDGSCLK
jgi:hypothetical protein